MSSLYNYLFLDKEKRENKHCSQSWSLSAVDRRAYWRLVKTLGFDPEPAKTIVGFWKWLDSSGGSGINSVLSHCLSVDSGDRLLLVLSHHALRCLNFLSLAAVSGDGDDELILTPTILSDEGFSLALLRENRERALQWIEGFTERADMTTLDSSSEPENGGSSFFGASRAFLARFFWFGF